MKKKFDNWLDWLKQDLMFNIIMIVMCSLMYAVVISLIIKTLIGIWN